MSCIRVEHQPANAARLLHVIELVEGRGVQRAVGRSGFEIPVVDDAFQTAGNQPAAIGREREAEDRIVAAGEFLFGGAVGGFQKANDGIVSGNRDSRFVGRNGETADPSAERVRAGPRRRFLRRLCHVPQVDPPPGIGGDGAVAA